VYLNNNRNKKRKDNNKASLHKEEEVAADHGYGSGSGGPVRAYNLSEELRVSVVWGRVWRRVLVQHLKVSANVIEWGHRPVTSVLTLLALIGNSEPLLF
jgi:hypothetical protein